MGVFFTKKAQLGVRKKDISFFSRKKIEAIKFRQYFQAFTESGNL